MWDLLVALQSLWRPPGRAPALDLLLRPYHVPVPCVSRVSVSSP